MNIVEDFQSLFAKARLVVDTDYAIMSGSACADDAAMAALRVEVERLEREPPLLTVGTIFLVPNQTIASENGVYLQRIPTYSRTTTYSARPDDDVSLLRSALRPFDAFTRSVLRDGGGPIPDARPFLQSDRANVTWGDLLVAVDVMDRTSGLPARTTALPMFDDKEKF